MYVRNAEWGPPGAAAARVELVARGLETPWGLAFLTPTAILVTERKGRVRLVTGSALVPDPVATVPVHADGEGGLLGIALAPDFAATRHFFLYYTHDDPGGGDPTNRIERWTLSSDARSAVPDEILVDGIAASPAHDGGRIRVGPDGMLWAGTGDARDRDLPEDLGSLNGKILRMTPDGAAPADNPWPGSVVWARGLRNVEAFDWLDPKASATAPGGGVLVIAEHGPSGELGRRGDDRILVSAPGADHGWPDAYGCRDGEGVTGASLSFQTALPPGGASFYRGDRIPEWKGSFLVATLGSRHLQRVAFDRVDPRVVVLHETYFVGDPPNGFGRLRDVVMGPDGEMYVTTSNCDGRGTCPPEGDAILRVTR
jgi:glucose/arabinose dehydrogenase